MEEWRVVPETNEKIEVSNYGRVRSLLRGEPYVLKATPDKKGYLRLKITINRVPKSYKVHRLVANSFIPNPNELPQVNHIDGDKTNNCVDNLEWCTNQDNVIHAISKEKVRVSDIKYIPIKKTINGKCVYLRGREYNTSKRANNGKKKIVAFNENDRIEFASIGEAERYFNSRHIVDVLKGRRSHVKGWSFSYLERG